MPKQKIQKKTLEIQTIYGAHTIILEPDEKKGYLVNVPGLDGIVTWGKDVTHAKRMAQEAIELCIECLVMKSKKTGLSRKITFRNQRAAVGTTA